MREMRSRPEPGVGPLLDWTSRSVLVTVLTAEPSAVCWLCRVLVLVVVLPRPSPGRARASCSRRSRSLSRWSGWGMVPRMPRKVTIAHTAHMPGHTGHTDGVEGNSLATLKTRGSSWGEGGAITWEGMGACGALGNEEQLNLRGESMWIKEGSVCANEWLSPGGSISSEGGSSRVQGGEAERAAAAGAFIGLSGEKSS